MVGPKHCWSFFKICRVNLIILAASLTELYLFIHTFIYSTFILTQEHDGKRLYAQSKQEMVKQNAPQRKKHQR